MTKEKKAKKVRRRHEEGEGEALEPVWVAACARDWAGAELSPWRKEESGGPVVASMPSASIAGRGEGVRERR